MTGIGRSLLILATSVQLVACASKAAKPHESSLVVKPYMAAEPGFLVTSNLIMGDNDAILVDAQFTRSEARKVGSLIRESGKRLTTIFITHGHPDHYLGLEVLAKEFPEARIVARPEVIADIKATAKGKIKYWKKMYKEDLADTFVLPQPITDHLMMLEGRPLEIVDMGAGESAHASAIYIPSIKALIAGDLAYNNVHLWLAEGRGTPWAEELRKITNNRTIEQVYPGHGRVASADILNTNAKYIEDFERITGTSKTKKNQAIAEIKNLYPDYALPVIAEISVGAKLK